MNPLKEPLYNPYRSLKGYYLGYYIRILYFRKLPLGVWYKGSIGCSKYSMGFVQGFYGVL